MDLTLEQQTLLALVRSSLWGAEAITGDPDWETVAAAALTQSVVPFAYDGAVVTHAPVPAELLNQWKKTALLGAMKSHSVTLAQSQLLEELKKAGIPTVILKGTSAAAAYPKPTLRLLGDVDLLVEQEDVPRAQEILETLGYTLHEAEHDFHLGFGRKDAYVEVHYRVTQFPDSPGGEATRRETEDFLKETVTGSISGQTFPMLTGPNQALSLVLHMARHLVDSGIGLRQMCDWAVYLHRADPAEMETVTLPMLERCGLKRFALCAAKVCVDYLGLPLSDAPWCGGVEAEVSARLMAEVFHGGNMGRAGTQRIGGLAADNKRLGQNRSRWQNMLDKACDLAYFHFPWAKKWKIALPLLWLFMAARYGIRAMLGLRPKKTVAGVLGAAKEQDSLFRQLRLFEK